MNERALTDGQPLIKIAIAAVIFNPYASRDSESLEEIVGPSAGLGEQFGRRLLAALAGRQAQSYGKAAIVGTEGEYEHGNAFLTTAFANPIRGALGGGEAWVPSTGKRGVLGTAIDVPLASKDALYVRSRYDTLTIGECVLPSASGLRPALEIPMHLAIYRARPDVMAICRTHSPYAVVCGVAEQAIHANHGFGGMLGGEVPVHPETDLIVNAAMGNAVAASPGAGVALLRHG